MTAPATATQLPEWVQQLRETGGPSDFISIAEAEPFLAVDRKQAYRQCNAYLARIGRELRRRHSMLLPVEVLYAQPGELPCVREGRLIRIRKHLLIVRLLGYEP